VVIVSPILLNLPGDEARTDVSHRVQYYYTIGIYINYETLDHVPSSCIAVMVHVVKGRQYSAYTVLHAGASIAEMESETDSRPR
jgi:hypothetical protein